MVIALAQINTVVADFSANREKILNFVLKAKKEKADLVLFPALSISGSPLKDLPENDRFVELNSASLNSLLKELPEDTAVGLGYVTSKSKSVYGLLLGGRLFFEQDLYAPLRELNVFEYLGERIAVTGSACLEGEDESVRFSDPGLIASLICVPSVLRFETGKYSARLEAAEQISVKSGVPLVNINAVGASDSFIYDGRSFISGPAGIVQEAAAFEEDLLIWNWQGQKKQSAGHNCGPRSKAAVKKDRPFAPLPSPGELDELEGALVLGIRDYMKKSGFTRAHLGLSGGIDSALVAYLGVKAAGPENFTCFSMPSRFSSQGSKDDAKELADNLGCRYGVLPIEPVFGSFLSVLEEVFEKRPFDLAEENLQSRIRGTMLMAFSNKFNSMLLTNGNKSELAMGYCTLYGDTNGALGPIGDIFKTEVFALCKRINERAEASGGKAVIPPAIIGKPPSAELKPDQKDEDSLPPYDVLDGILRLFLHEKLSLEEIVKKGWKRETAVRIIRTVIKNEFKRRQCPPVLYVSGRPFGDGEAAPLNRFVYEV